MCIVAVTLAKEARELPAVRLLRVRLAHGTKRNTPLHISVMSSTTPFHPFAFTQSPLGFERLLCLCDDGLDLGSQFTLSLTPLIVSAVRGLSWGLAVI